MNKQFPKLNKRQAGIVVKKMKEILGPEIVEMINASGLNPSRMIRFQYIASLCKNTREERGLSLKEASKQLKIPAYRLNAIEGSNIHQVVPDFFDKYIEFLGLSDEFEKWQQDNQDICNDIGKNSK